MGALGAEGWSWQNALPYFKKLERDVDFSDDFHGNDGPIPIRRIKPDRISPFVTAMSDTFAAQGYVKKPDQNGKWADGIYVGAVVVSDDGERVPTSVGYLTDPVRARPNLEILTGYHVERVVFSGTRATGAIVRPASGGATPFSFS